MEKVQVFIPTYNRVEFLKNAIISIQSQTYQNIEIIILDNNSQDMTELLVKELAINDHRIKYIRNDKNIGMIANFNQIKNFVTADYFCVLTDDDIYEPVFLEEAINVFECYPASGFVALEAFQIINGIKAPGPLATWREGFYKKNTAVKKCIKGKYPLITTCLFRAVIAKDFVFHADILSTGDFVLLTCLIAKYDFSVSKVMGGSWNTAHGKNFTLMQIYDPTKHVKEVFHSLLFYHKFCDENSLPVKGRLLLRKKALVALLYAGNYNNNLNQLLILDEVKKVFNYAELFVIRILYHVNFLNAVLKAKSLLRNVFTYFL